MSRGAFFGRGLLPPDEHPPPDDRRPGLAGPAARPPPISSAGSISRRAASGAIRENPLAALKTTSRADYVYARLEARTAGADDALFLTIDGYLSEATSANLFVVPRRGELATPSLGLRDPARHDPRLDPALGRGASGWRSRGLLTTRDLHEADEAFLSSSVAGILPVTRFAGEAIGTGRPGPWTLRARADREAFIREGAAS